MPPRVTVEDFDDDTDLPLPIHPFIPNTGARGAVLEEAYDFDPSPSAPEPSPPTFSNNRPPPALPESPRRENVITDTTPFKNWTTIYPIYIDAKRSYGPERRIARDKAVWWPVSKDIAQAAVDIGIKCLHEPNKTHPRDWENPGRVKVLWKKDGHLVYQKAKTRKQLIEMLAATIQKTKPHLKPTPSAKPSSEPSKLSTQGGSSEPPKKKSHRQKLKDKAKIPPKPFPPRSTRISPYSPMLESGILIDTVKAGMNAPNNQLPGAEGGGLPGSGAKGKRKVVRVRG